MPSSINAIKNLIFHDSDGNRPKVKIDIQSLIKNYEVQYIEGGRNKPGEWSRAWLLVHTFRPSNLPDNKLDKYLENLFPSYRVTIAEGEDDDQHRSKNEILRRLQKEVGYDKIERIKVLCREMTNHVREFAVLTYCDEDHAEFLFRYYNQLRKDAISQYK